MGSKILVAGWAHPDDQLGAERLDYVVLALYTVQMMEDV